MWMRPSWHHNKYHSISCYDKKPAGRCDMFWLTNSTYGPEDGYLEDVYLIRLYPRHFYQISRELFSTDLSDEAYHSIHIPFLLANIFFEQSAVYLLRVFCPCYCFPRCAGETSWSVSNINKQPGDISTLILTNCLILASNVNSDKAKGKSQVLLICPLTNTEVFTLPLPSSLWLVWLSVDVEPGVSPVTCKGVYSYLSQPLINLKKYLYFCRGLQNHMKEVNIPQILIFPLTVYDIPTVYTHVTYARVSVRFV